MDWNEPRFENYFETFDAIPPAQVPWFTDRWWVSPLNYLEEVHEPFPPSVYIQDVTLRDGEQTPGVVFNEDERVRIALALDEIGIQVIEVGIPAVHESIGRAIKRLLDMNLRATLLAPTIAKREEVNRCLDTGVRAIALGHPLNPYLCKYAYDVHSVEQLVDRLAGVIDYAKSNGLYVQLHGWDVFRNPLPYLLKLYGELVKAAPPDCITIMDTFGVVIPSAVEIVVREIKRVVGDVKLDIHTHNEYGLGVAAVTAAVAGGAIGIHGAMNGLGERTGNVPTEQAAATMELLLGVDTGVDLSGLSGVSRLVAEIAKVSVPPNQPIVGGNLFDLESGLPVRLVRKLEKCGINTGFSTYVPEVVGLPERKIVLGKGSGHANIQFHLERLGLTATEAEADRLVELVKEESRVRKSALTEEDFSKLALAVLHGEAEHVDRAGRGTSEESS